MTDFDYDVMEKKRIARGAFNRKCGSKSKKCSLPSDHMTQGQWKKRNGDVIVFSMDKPVLWQEFTQLSHATQKEYLSHLVDVYRASGATISNMMGVSYTKFVKHCRLIGFSLTGCRGHNMTKEQRAEWDRFCCDTEAGSPSEPHSSSGPILVPADEAVSVQIRTGVSNARMQMHSFSLSFSGIIDPDAIANSIRSIVGCEGTIGDVTINCVVVGQQERGQ